MSSKALAARHQPTRALQFKRTPIWADIHRDLLHEKVRVWCVVVRDLLSDPPSMLLFSHNISQISTDQDRRHRRAQDSVKNVEPKVLESHAEWRAADVADPESWTLHLDDHDHAELDAALALAKQTSADPLEIRREDFPLERLGDKLESTLNMLANGRGFTRISALDAGRYSEDDITLLFWGIGLYLGEARVQNQYGHLLGDVTDQGKSPTTPPCEAMSWAR
jgi:hypothetical protein